MNRLLLSMLIAASLAPVAKGQTTRQSLPLEHGTLRLYDLNAALCDALDLPRCPTGGKVDLDGASGSEFLTAVNACLWNGCVLQRTSASTATLTIQTKRSLSRIDAVRRLSRVYAAENAPHATAAQARNWGLLAPQTLDPSRPLVVLIHGLDADRSDCVPIGQLLQDAGQQVAYFSYPGEQPIEESAASLGRAIEDLRKTTPRLTIDIVAHSMGGLVARQYVEGPSYAGGVDRMILVAPPNHGSNWARLRTILSIEENLHLRQDDPNWSWTWLVTEGLGEAANDLLPGSPFLQDLNARPRRAGVRYTIIAGNHSGVHRAEANCLQQIADCIPSPSRNWWGVRACYRHLHRSADRLHMQTGGSDGPVTLASTRLAGVSDYIVLPADHISLYLPLDGHPPAAWEIIRNRIAPPSR